jgi:hypothetical protein
MALAGVVIRRASNEILAKMARIGGVRHLNSFPQLFKIEQTRCPLAV